MNRDELIALFSYTLLAVVCMALVLILFFYFSRKKIIKQEVEKKNLEINYQKELLHAVITTQEEERKRIARDLHDDISSKLNIVSLNSQMLGSPKLTENEIGEITTNIISLTAKALENSRRIAHDLFPPVLENFGLFAAVKELAVDYTGANKLHINFENNCKGDLILPKNTQLQVFRIIQELVNNSIRHGKATAISIVFEPTSKKFNCFYSDNGVGFDIKQVKLRSGLGMKSIESRVELIQAEIAFETSPNNGFKATLIL